MRSRTTSRAWDVLFGLLWMGILLNSVFSYWGQSYDDVFLAFRYAQNIEAGHGFVFNVGENFLGTPAPLFVAMLVGLHKALPFITIPQTGSLISGVGLAMASLGVYLIGRKVDKRLVGALAAVLIATNPFPLLTMGGETPLYLAFVIHAILLYISAREGWAAFLLGLALMNRSEAVVPIGLLLLVDLISKRRLPIRMGLITAAAYTPWLAFSLWQFGSPLTNSFTAKVAQVSAGAVRFPYGLVDWLLKIILRNNSLFWWMVPLLALGCLVLFDTHKAWRLLLAWTLLQTLLYVFLPIPFYHWYAAQIGVLAAVLAALGAARSPGLFRKARDFLIQAKGERNRGFVTTVNIAWGAVVGLTFLLMGVTLYAHLQTAYRYAQAWPHSPANDIYRAAGEWLAANTPPDASIAYEEIGAIGFYSGRHIIDTLGLVTPGVAAQVAKSNWLWPFLRYKPDYIIYNPMFDDWTDADAIFGEDWFLKGFREVGQVAMPPYPFPLHIYERQPEAVIPDPVELDIAQPAAEKAIGEIYGNRSVHQDFVAHHNRLAAVELLLATYARQNQGTLTVTLHDGHGIILKVWHVPTAEIYDNTWRRFYLDPIPDSSGKRYTLMLDSADSQPGNAITVWMSGKAHGPDWVLQYGSQVIEGVIAFRIYYSSP